MGKALKMTTRFRNVKIKLVRRSVAGPAKLSYLSQGLPQPSFKQTHPSDPSITSQLADPDDATPSCSESAYSKAKKRELHAWDAVKDEMLKNVYYEPSSLGLFLYLPEGHGTHAVYTKDMKVIVSTGRLCTVTVNMCACEPETCSLLRYGLWPATADKPQTDSLLHPKLFADGDIIVTLDANFGLVRKQSSSTSAVEPLNGTRMILDEKDVEEYLLSHLDSSKPQELERKRHQATVMFNPHVPDIVPADNPYLCQALPMTSIQTLVYNDDGDNDEDAPDDDNDN
ncbi:uncharacterized protein LOC132116593 [Carassius carassius]|uniref:uncharacterized protein LOC132116593 n=1 Tax=Carassius carassius TaxID=217509 RepID=UPI002869431F|nr:uncharacterized protein LOC132116593 [Carassius carassius]